MEEYRELGELMRDSSTDVVLEYIRRKNINAESFANVINIYQRVDRCLSPLGLAIKHGHLLVMNELISLGFDPTTSIPCSTDYERKLPLHLACEYNRLDIIHALRQDHGIDMDYLSDYGFSALVEAVYKSTSEKTLDVVKTLVEAGASVNTSCRSGTTPLYAAIEMQNIDACRYLISMGADVNSRKDGTYLTHALDCRVDIDTEKSGADVNAVYEEKKSALIYAIDRNAEIDVFRVLLDCGADVNALDKMNKSPLCYALDPHDWWSINDKMIETIKLLVNSGADVNLVDNNQVSPLMYALKNRYVVKNGVIRLLVESGANVNAVNDNQKSPLHYAVINSGRDSIQVLVESGADVNIQDANGDSPLMYALKYKARVTVMLLLLECGADVCTRNQEDISPLSYICKRSADFKHVTNDYGEDINLVYTFVKHAGDVKGHLITLPDTRRIHDALNVIRTLCTKGADIEARDETGNTVLHQVMTKLVPCSCAKCFNCLHYLIVKLNLSLWTLNNANQTAFHCALMKAEFRREPAAEILKLCVKAGYTPDSEDMVAIRQIEEELSTEIKGSDVTSLQDSCCFSVRRALGRRLPTAVNSLPIPEKLKQRVKLTHIETMIETPENTVEYHDAADAADSDSDDFDDDDYDSYYYYDDDCYYVDSDDEYYYGYDDD